MVLLGACSSYTVAFQPCSTRRGDATASACFTRTFSGKHRDAAPLDAVPQADVVRVSLGSSTTQIIQRASGSKAETVLKLKRKGPFQRARRLVGSDGTVTAKLRKYRTFSRGASGDGGGGSGTALVLEPVQGDKKSSEAAALTSLIAVFEATGEEYSEICVYGCVNNASTLPPALPAGSVFKLREKENLIAVFSPGSHSASAAPKTLSDATPSFSNTLRGTLYLSESSFGLDKKELSLDRRVRIDDLLAQKITCLVSEALRKQAASLGAEKASRDALDYCLTGGFRVHDYVRASAEAARSCPLAAAVAVPIIAL